MAEDSLAGLGSSPLGSLADLGAQAYTPPVEAPDVLAPTNDMKTGLPVGYMQKAKDFMTAPLGKGPLAGISESIPAAPMGLAMPPAAGLIGRSLLQGGGAGLDAAMAGKGPMDIAKEAGKGAAFNVGAEKVLGPLGRFIGKQAAPANAAAKLAHDTSMTGALNTAAEATHAAATVAHADKGAAQIAQSLIDQVPALKGTEVSGKGLYDAIYGSGKKKVSAAFDEAFKDVVAQGKGKIVQIPEDAASKLGLTSAGPSGVAGLPANVQALFNKGAQKAGMSTAGQSGMIGVDAAELAAKATGKFVTDPKSYRAAMGALEEAGLGNAAARSAYKAYSGYADFLDKSKALDANGVLNPDKVMKAMADLKKVEVLRRRGLGSGTEGAIQEAVRGGPLAPTPHDIPMQPDNISSIKNPLAGHSLVSGMAGGAMGGAIAHGAGMGPLGHLLGFMGGAGVANALPKQIVTKGPLSAAAEKASTNIPDIVGILARLGYNKMTST